jgi:hypothetical protein
MVEPEPALVSSGMDLKAEIEFNHLEDYSRYKALWQRLNLPE